VRNTDKPGQSRLKVAPLWRVPVAQELLDSEVTDLVCRVAGSASKARTLLLCSGHSTTERRLQPQFQTLLGCIWADLRDEVGTSLNKCAADHLRPGCRPCRCRMSVPLTYLNSERHHILWRPVRLTPAMLDQYIPVCTDRLAGRQSSAGRLRRPRAQCPDVQLMWRRGRFLRPF
jgi:hypothetical protein